MDPAAQHLPHTDGADLMVRPSNVGPLERLSQLRAARRACDGPCVTPFGLRLGVSGGVEARSNCVSTCLRLDFSYVDLESGEIRVGKTSPDPQLFEYAGVTYQCVEYARRWWIQNLGLTFGDVPTATDIFSLKEGQGLPDRTPIPLGRSLNGSAKRAPQRGDLVIYAPDLEDAAWRFGHVAVVVEVDLDQGWVALAEENYDNRPWRDPTAYARRIRLFAVGGRFTLMDVQPGAIRNPAGGRIAGWVYPLTSR
ncbi:CHAP domain-containing protein [Thiorhodococcus fuscus]|uniref:CHAP domain-containing protein n=1 Tax=Thiorhodococcus fuscus TaxID=527200 RepID=A0ABW4Y279_9GAMM